MMKWLKITLLIILYYNVGHCFHIVNIDKFSKTRVLFVFFNTLN